MRRLPMLVTGALVACGDDGGGAPALRGAAAKGEHLVAERGCLSCHSTDGNHGNGPTWDGLAGSTVTLDDGRTVPADRGYLRRSILDPDADTVVGFPAGLMRAAVPPGSLTAGEVEAIVAYLETLGNHADGSDD